MPWSHRLIKQTLNKGKTHESVRVAIHEYYWSDDDGEEISMGTTENPVAPQTFFESFDETYSEEEAKERLREILTWMLAALDKPIINRDEGE